MEILNYKKHNIIAILVSVMAVSICCIHYVLSVASDTVIVYSGYVMSIIYLWYAGILITRSHPMLATGYSLVSTALFVFGYILYWVDPIRYLYASMGAVIIVVATSIIFIVIFTKNEE